MKWLNPYCHPTTAHTMNKPAQLSKMEERRRMTLAWEEFGVLGEKDSYKKERKVPVTANTISRLSWVDMGCNYNLYDHSTFYRVAERHIQSVTNSC